MRTMPNVLLAPLRANKIIPSRFHVPPRAPWFGSPPSANAVGGPPEMLIFMGLVFAKKPTNLLSVDQNGAPVALSVPGSGLAVNPPIGRIQTALLPSITAMYATCCPSGEIERERS